MPTDQACAALPRPRVSPELALALAAIRRGDHDVAEAVRRKAERRQRVVAQVVGAAALAVWAVDVVLLLAV